jgi:hypothetical protein
MINVYNNNYERVGFIESYSYLSWVRRYSDVGEFELKCAPENLPLLSIGNILTKLNDNEGAVIETLNIETEEQETVTVRGRFLSALLESRIVWGTESLSGDIGSCVFQLINNNATNPPDEDRAIPNLKYENINIGKNLGMQVSYDNLLETVVKICSSAEAGIKGVLNPAKGITLLLYNGRELPFVFSREFENLLSQNYTDSIRDCANVALIAGEGEGIERKLAVTGGETGLSRKEVFVDARDLRLADYENDDKYIEALKLKGRIKMYEKRRRESFDAAVNTNGNLIYREDFDLGDIVTVKSSLLGISARLRITEIAETYDSDGFHVDVVFGNPLPLLKESLKGVV